MHTSPVRVRPPRATRALANIALAALLATSLAALPAFAVRAGAQPAATEEAVQAEPTAGASAAQPVADASSATSDAQQIASPCSPTAEQLAAWEADGTLEARKAYAAQLSHDQPDPALMAEALARQQAADSVSDNDDAAQTLAQLPINWQNGMPTEGQARVIALHVSFPAGDGEPAYGFSDGDTVEALDALIDGDGGAFPYEDLQSYYERSSYGKLSISGDAFEYEAAFPRSHYETNMASLFYEALEALDSQIDYTDYDGNGDGIIDAVYLRFGGPSGSWGSPWWSYTESVKVDAPTYDGVTPCRLIRLAEPSNSANGAATIIHETGHALGLPDYYSYAAQTQIVSGRTGILTFDMMSDNTGDHNGFSKWLLGWLDGDDVTRVVATSDGVTATRGGAVLATSAAGTDAGVALDLGAFVSDNPTATGGIIVASNADEGIFSSYYVLEYDGHAGNDSVSYRTSTGEVRPLPNGFRMFRVQASLTDDGTDFATTNAYGRVNDQLIEMVDPDMAAEHTSLSLSSTEPDGYGCMLYEGDAITPDTFPSTNFYENKGLGYTGLCVAVTGCNPESGQVTIAHTGNEAADLPAFDITARSGQRVYNAGTLTFDATTAPWFDPSKQYQSGAKLIVDGAPHDVSLAVSGTEITVAYRFDPNEISPDSTCSIRFPATTFEVANTPAGIVYSPEITVPLETGDVADVAAEGSYGTDTIAQAGKLTSNAMALEDGRIAFFQLADGDDAAQPETQVKLCTARNGSDELSAVPVDTANVPVNAGTQLRATDLRNGTALLAVRNDDDLVENLLVVNLADGSLIAHGSVSNTSQLSFEPVGDGSFLATGVAHELSGPLFVRATPQSDGTLTMRFATVDESGMAFAAGGGRIVLAIPSYDDPVGTNVTLLSAADVAKTVEQHGVDSMDKLYGAVLGSTSHDSADAAGTLPKLAGVDLWCDGLVALKGASASDAGIALVFAGAYDPTGGATAPVRVFEPDGTLRASFDIESSQNGTSWMLSEFDEIAMDGEGNLAASRASASVNGVMLRETVFVPAADGTAQSRLIAHSTGDGAWFANGSWTSVGWHMDAGSFAAGSPDAEGASSGPLPSSSDAIMPQNDLRYYVVNMPEPTSDHDVSENPDEPTDPDTPTGPGTSTDPDQPTDPDTPNAPDEPHAQTSAEPQSPSSSENPSASTDHAAATSSNNELAKTGDNVVIPLVATGAVAVAALAAAALAWLRMHP